MPSGSAASAARPLARTDNLELAIPECSKGIGAVIGSPESADLIAGVRIQPFSLFADDRGYFLEAWSAGPFEALGIANALVQDNQSLSKRKGTPSGLDQSAEAIQRS